MCCALKCSHPPQPVKTRTGFLCFEYSLGAGGAWVLIDIKFAVGSP